MILDFTMVHTATVETYQGAGAYGDIWAAGVDIPCYIETEDVLVTNANGVQVTQRNTTLSADLSYAPLLTVQSKVTSSQLGSDGVARVAKVTLEDSGALNLGLDHVLAVLL